MKDANEGTVSGAIARRELRLAALAMLSDVDIASLMKLVDLANVPVPWWIADTLAASEELQRVAAMASDIQAEAARRGATS